MSPCELKLSNQLHALKAEFEAFKALMDERKERLDERDEANKRAIEAAFNSAEKAAEKTESALKEYKVGANEWRDTVKDLIANLRESRSQTVGKDEALLVAQATQRWMVGLAAGVLLAVLVPLIKMFFGR